MKMMNKPRCGVPDNTGFSNAARRKKRYSTVARWPTKNLIWRINSFTTDLAETDTRDIVTDALQVGRQ